MYLYRIYQCKRLFTLKLSCIILLAYIIMLHLFFKIYFRSEHMHATVASYIMVSSFYT